MLIGEKVILEEIDHSNIEQLRQWRNDPTMRKFFREYKDITKNKQEMWYNERGNNTNPAHIYFQIMKFSSGAPEIRPEYVDVGKKVLIGCCNLSYIDYRLRSAEFGIFLGSNRGSGRGKEALVLMCDFGFKELNLHKIWCEVFDNNESVNLYRKMGFRDEGILRDSYYHDGSYGNSYVLSILENEWREKYGEGSLRETKSL